MRRRPISWIPLTVWTSPR